METSELLVSQKYLILLVCVFVWSLIWKGFALWKSARRNERWWFIALLLVNTMGVFEILYIFVITKYFGKKS